MLGAVFSFFQPFPRPPGKLAVQCVHRFQQCARSVLDLAYGHRAYRGRSLLEYRGKRPVRPRSMAPRFLPIVDRAKNSVRLASQRGRIRVDASSFSARLLSRRGGFRSFADRLSFPTVPIYRFSFSLQRCWEQKRLTRLPARCRTMCSTCCWMGWVGPTRSNTS